MINGLQVYPDQIKKNVFYYSPGTLIMATDNFGDPLFQFLQLRYSGTAVMGDQGVFKYKSLLEFTVKMNNPPSESREKVNQLLSVKYGSKIELIPIPIRKIKATLVYALAEETEHRPVTPAILDGTFDEKEDTESETSEYWSERTFNLNLDNYSSQLFWNALSKGQVLMSIGYAFYATGVQNILKPQISVVGIESKQIREQMDQMLKEEKMDSISKMILIKADAFPVTIDIKKHSGKIKKIDINESWIPPGYAVMDIRCYDFNNEIRKDLYAKRLEICATGMDGNEVRQNVTFFASSPDIYSRNLKFKYAIKLNKPYKYRIIEINNDAAPKYGKWLEEKDWNKLIDITTELK